MNSQPIIVIGGGLAGSEAAWQIAQRGLAVQLYEMRPGTMTPAHTTARLAELVCSNSLKSDQTGSAPWLLKEELKCLDSLLLRVAMEHRVPSGASLSVDRERFAGAVTEAIQTRPQIEIIRREVTTLPEERLAIIASGPLTSPALAASIQDFAESRHLYFYDAISPIVEADSIDYSKVFRASRYDKGEADFLNCPFTKEEYFAFYDALINAELAPIHACEQARYFEACLPIEEMARRGIDTLRFGPMKPVGLTDPRTGRWPYAVVQLRQETLRANSYNLVGFQNHLRFGAQERVLRMIPGLEQARFTHFGQMHRNTFINAPLLIDSTLQTKKNPQLLFAGQIAGVEGYVECIATGLVAGINAARLALGKTPDVVPSTTAAGSLLNYLASADPARFQPENINFGIMPTLKIPPGSKRLNKKEKHQLQAERALAAIAEYAAKVNPHI